MASVKRFVDLRGTLRNHPMIVASTAATVGVLLGGFVAVQLLDTSQPRADSALAPQAAAETKASPKPVAETTGSAAAGDSVASAECEQQTWPHLSRVCMEEYRSKHRAARVVSTDKLNKQTVDAIESTPVETAAKPELAAPAPWAPAVASITPLAPTSVAMTSGAPISAAPAATPEPSAAVAAAPEPSPAVAGTDAQASPPPSSKTAAKSEAKEKHAARKTKRKPKAERRAPAKPELEDDDDNSVAVANSDDRDDDRIASVRRDRYDDRIASGRRDRSRRIVERWIERDYDVPADNGRGRRRVTVIHRGGGGGGGGGGLFGNMFGGDGD